MTKPLDRDAITAAFDKAVNMAPAELEQWLATGESQAVGDSHAPGGNGGESTGHKSGRWIVRIQRTPPAERDDFDYRHMRKVVGYVHRHLAQRPRGDVRHTRWRYSLMNWGHDPLK